LSRLPRDTTLALIWPLTERTSIDTTRHSLEVKSDTYDPRNISSLQNDANGVYIAKSVPIAGSPTTSAHDEKGVTIQNGKARTSIEDTEKEKEKDKSAGKKVQKMLKNRVHKEQQRISTIGRKIGHGVGKQRGGLTLRRTTSTPGKEPLVLFGIPADLSSFISIQQTCTKYWESIRRRIKPLLSTPVVTVPTLRPTTSSVPNRLLHYLLQL